MVVQQVQCGIRKCWYEVDQMLYWRFLAVRELRIWSRKLKGQVFAYGKCRRTENGQ